MSEQNATRTLHILGTNITVSARAWDALNECRFLVDGPEGREEETRLSFNGPNDDAGWTVDDVAKLVAILAAPGTLVQPQPPALGIALGATVTDRITGFTGVVTGRVNYLTGCTQVLVAPKSTDGRQPDSAWLDEQRAIVSDEALITLDNGPTPGFDKPAPKR